MKRIEIIVLLVFLNALVAFGQQSTYVLNINTPDKIEDTAVGWGQSDIRGVNRQESNDGQNIYIDAMAWTWDGIPGINRALIKFDLDQLPANSEIVKAELSLYHYEIENIHWPMSNLSGSNEVYLQRVTSDWVEDEVTWNTQPSTTVENQVILPGSSSRTQDYLDIDVTELVNQIVVSGENYGFMLQLATEEYYRCMIFCSSEYEDSTLSPKLVIEYKIKESNQAFISNVRKISQTQGGFTGQLDINDQFSVGTPIGDINDDGIEDLAVGAMVDDDGTTDAGAVWILFLNEDKTVKSHQKISATDGGFNAQLNTDRFGSGVTSIGDFDKDGIEDIAVGAYYSDDGYGAIYLIFLKKDGTVKSYQKISSTQGGLQNLTANRFFGSSICPLGDLNNDGTIDLAVGAPNYDNDGGLYCGSIWILFLNQNGTVKNQQIISQTQGGFDQSLDDRSRFGRIVSNIGDIDGDGINDIAASCEGDDDGGTDSGALYILFLNSNGTVKGKQKISATQGNFTGTINSGDNFGCSSVGLGDEDGDGINDIVVSALWSDQNGTDRGKLFIINLNINGTVKSWKEINSSAPELSSLLENGDLFGNALSAFPGVNPNGKKELIVGACGDDDGFMDAGAVYILDLGVTNFLTLSKSSSTFTAVGGIDNVTISSDVTWTASSDQSWLTVNPASGTGNNTLVLTASQNTTPASRTATVTVTSPGLAPKTITITQLASQTKYLTVAATAVNIGFTTGSTVSVAVTSNTTWTAQSDQTWLTVNPTSATGNGNLIFAAEANTGDSIRIAKVTVSATGVESRTITVTQSRKPFLNVSANTVPIARGYGSMATDEVISNIDWNASSNQTWLRVSPKSGYGNQSLVFTTTSANPKITQRSATVTVTGEGVSPQLITVMQAAGDTILTVTDTNLNIGYAEGSKVWTAVTSNTIWRVESDQPWLTPNPASSEGNKNLIFTANENPNDFTRTATISVMALGAETKTIMITQTAKPVLSLMTDTLLIAKEEGSTVTLAISANVGWRAESDEPWLSVDPETGFFEDTLTFTANANPGVGKRSSVVSISGVGVGIKRVTVIQEAGDPILVVSGNSVFVEKEEGSTATVTVTSNTNWNASCDQSWLAVSHSAWTGDGALIFTAQVNPTIKERKAIVTVSEVGIEPQQITVTQEAGDPVISISGEDINIAPEEGSKATMEVISNTSWSVSTDETWLTLAPSTGTGNGSIILTAKANPSAMNRPADITITDGGAISQTIVVVQLAGHVSSSTIKMGTVSLFPNPVTDGFRIKGLDGKAEIFVSDLSGKLLLSKEIDGDDYIPATSLSKGVYIVRITNAEGRIEKKLVKE